MAYESRMKYLRKLPVYFEEHKFPEIPDSDYFDDESDYDFYDTELEDDTEDYDDGSEDIYDYIRRQRL